MANDSKHLRDLARRVKQKALEKAEEILTNPDKYSKELYSETYLTVLKNAVPRTQEITGEDGEAIKMEIVKYADSVQIPAEGLPASVIESI